MEEVKSKQEIEIERKQKMRFRLSWLFVFLDIALVAYIIYQIVKLVG